MASPVWKIPPPTINSPTIIITVVFEKPASASEGVNICESKSAKRAHIATRSERTLPLTKSAAAMSKMIIVVSISDFFVVHLLRKDKKNFYNDKFFTNFRQIIIPHIWHDICTSTRYETSVYFTYGNNAIYGAGVRGAKV